MPDNVEWHGPEASRHVHDRAARFITAACILVTRRAKELLSVSGTGERIAGKVVQAVKSTGKRIYGAFPSKPGEPPRKQTGHLRRSVTYEVNPESLVGRVGTNVPYGRYLELGTKRGLAPRPWLRRALAEMRSQIMRLLDSLGAS